MLQPYATATLLALVRFVLAQADEANNTTPTASDEITIPTITVGKLPNKYDPNSIIATPGDVVTFEFWSGNHSAARAAYGFPCVPYEDIAGQPGFFPGFRSPTEIGRPSIWNLTVNTTSPIFWYCEAPGSCVGYGMVGVINPSINTSLNTQIELSRQADYMLVPGQVLPEAALLSMSSLVAAASTATVTVTATESAPASEQSEDPGEYDDPDEYATSSATPAPSSTSSPAPVNSPPSPSLSAGGIAGIAIGGVAFLVIAAALCFFLGRTKTMKEELNRLRGKPTPGTGDGGEGAGFMAAHSGAEGKHDQATQLPPYRCPSPEIQHTE